MNQNSELPTVEFRESLARGKIPLDRSVLLPPISIEAVFQLVSDDDQGKHREWQVKNDSWRRDSVVTEILWYPPQPVFFTFRNGYLVLIEFSGLGEPKSEWDYSIEVQKYSSLKKDVVKHLGREDRVNEVDTKNMETVWEFSMLTLFVACDSKTGGCGVGLRIRDSGK